MQKKFFLAGCLTLMSCFSMAQSSLIFKDNPYIVIKNNAHIVINNHQDTAIKIVNGGNIISEGEGNVVHWNIGNATGDYTIPFTSNNNVKIPLTINVGVAGDNGGQIVASTYETTTDSNQVYPSDVTNMATPCSVNNALDVIDRFWRVDGSSYTTSPQVALKFTYDDGNAEMGGQNVINEAMLKAQRFNTTASSWEAPTKLFGTADPVNNEITTSPIPIADFFQSWSIVDYTNMQINVSRFDTICQGDSILLGGAYQFASGIFYDTVETVGACDTIYRTDLHLEPMPVAQITAILPVCIDSAVFNLTATINGGSWSGTGIVDPVTGAFDPSVSGVGDFDVYYQLGTLCVDKDTATITVNPLPNIFAGVDSSLCLGDSINLIGSGGIIFTWNNGVVDGVTFTPALDTLDYIVEGIDVNGCKNTDTLTIEVVPFIAPQITSAATYCSNDQTIQLTADIAGGTWTGDGIVDATLGSYTPSAIVSSPTQVYYVLDTACTKVDTLDIIVYDAPEVIAGLDTILCEGDSVFFKGQGADTYVWDGGIQDSVYFTPIVGLTTYTVIGTTSDGCSDSAQVIVEILSQPVASIGNIAPLCQGETPIQLSASQTGGTWSGTGITDPVLGTFNPVDTGNVLVHYTFGGQCPAIDSVMLRVNSLPIVSADLASLICEGDSLHLLGTGANTYTWQNGYTNDTIFAPSVGQYTYYVEGVDNNGCIGNDTLQVTVVPKGNAVITPISAICISEGDITLSATPAGGTWNGVGMINSLTGTFNPSGLSEGNYDVTYEVVNATCVIPDTVNIEVLASPEVNETITHESCFGEMDGSASYVSLGINTPYIYTWNTGQTGEEITGLVEGDYTVSIENTLGCVVSRTVTILGNKDCDYEFVIANAFTPNGDGKNDVLHVKSKGMVGLNFLVFDRWGNKIFENTAIDAGWDGTYKGKELNAGVYVYYVEITYFDGIVKESKGNITLIR